MNDDELSAMQVPAQFTDTFYLSVSNARVRIAFGEQAGGVAAYSSAVAMSKECAASLMQLLTQFIEVTDEQK